MVHFLGTIFSSILIHIWRSKEYFWQQGNVCGSEWTAACLLMLMVEHVTQCTSGAHWCVLNSFGIWTIEHKEEEISVFDTHNILVRYVHCCIRSSHWSFMVSLVNCVKNTTFLILGWCAFTVAIFCLIEMVNRICILVWHSCNVTTNQSAT